MDETPLPKETPELIAIRLAQAKALAISLEKARQQDVDDYNAGKKKVILISSAGGEGLDLPNTTMVASLDGHWKNNQNRNRLNKRNHPHQQMM